MIIRSNFAERRKHTRFKANEGTLAEFHMPRLFKFGISRVVKSAQIVDISLEGLAFQYEDRNVWSTDFNTLTISKATDKIKIDKVPYKAISDFSTSRLPNSKFLRRCGVQFGELRPVQKNQLHYFIQNLPHSIDRRTGKDRRVSKTSKDDDLVRRDIVDRRKRLL